MTSRNDWWKSRPISPRVAHALKPGGRFVIESVKTAEIVLPPPAQPRQWQIGDFAFSAQNSYDAETRWMDNRYTVSREDRCEVRDAAFRVYLRAEVEALLEANGFGRCESLGSLAGEPFAPDSSRLILVASKRS